MTKHMETLCDIQILALFVLFCSDFTFFEALECMTFNKVQVHKMKWRRAANKKHIFNCWHHLMSAHGGCSLCFSVHGTGLYCCVMLIALIITPSFAHRDSWSEALCWMCFISGRGNTISSPTAKAFMQPSSHLVSSKKSHANSKFIFVPSLTNPSSFKRSRSSVWNGDGVLKFENRPF